MKKLIIAAILLLVNLGVAQASAVLPIKDACQQLQGTTWVGNATLYASGEVIPMVIQIQNVTSVGGGNYNLTGSVSYKGKGGQGVGPFVDTICQAKDDLVLIYMQAKPLSGPFSLFSSGTVPMEGNYSSLSLVNSGPNDGAYTGPLFIPTPDGAAIYILQGEFYPASGKK